MEDIGLDTKILIVSVVVAFLAGVAVPFIRDILKNRQPSDKELFAAWKQTFNRFAFRGPFEFHSEPEPFKRAIEQIVKEVNSGVPDMDRSRGMTYLRSKDLQDKMQAVLARLQDLNEIAGRWADEEKRLTVTPEERHRLDTRRDEIIAILNPVWEKFGLGKLPVPTAKTWSEMHE